jgi:hypothetical protein
MFVIKQHFKIVGNLIEIFTTPSMYLKKSSYAIILKNNHNIPLLAT